MITKTDIQIGGAAMSEPKRVAHPYDSAFKTLVHEAAELMIPLVNAVFGTTFRGDEKIVLRAEEAERRIDDNDRSVVHTSLTTVLRGLSRKYGNILRGVENTMKGEILEYEAKRIRNTANAEGRAEGRMEMLFDLVGKGRLTELEASEEIKMPIADLQQRMAEYGRAHE